MRRGNGREHVVRTGIRAAEQYASPIFLVAIGLHIFKSGGDKIQVINSDGDMSPASPVEMTPLPVSQCREVDWPYCYYQVDE